MAYRILVIDDEEDILHAIDHHAYHGTTTIYPSTVAAACDTLRGALRRLRNAIQSGRALANVPGVHLEGPYFSPAQCGAQNTAFITPPVPEEYEALLAEYGDVIKRWSLAPELPGSREFLRCIHAAGVVSSMGHTNAKYEDVLMAREEGCSLITHFYFCISTAFTQFFISIAIVIGPTPPGTGVIALVCGATSS